MAILGTYVDRTNPEYTIADFVFWMPQYKKYCQTEDGITMFNNLYPIANNKIFYSIWGSDWKYAMSLCIAHYSYLIAIQQTAPSGDTLPQIAGGGVTKGTISSASIGGFTKSYDLGYTAFQASNFQDAGFWNQSSYGMALYALYKTKAVPTIFVVTDGPLVPGTPPFNPRYWSDKDKDKGGWPF